MNLFRLSSLLIFVSTLTMAIFLFLKGRDRKLSIIWGCFCLIVSIWGFGGFKFSASHITEHNVFFWWKVAYIGVIFTPILYAHFVFEYLKLERKKLLIFLYTVCFFFLGLNFYRFEFFLGDLKYVFNQFYWHDWLARKNISFLIFQVSYYWLLNAYAFYYIIRGFVRATGVKRQQLKYFILASIIGWIGPHGDFLLDYGFKIYPYTNFLIAFFPLIIIYGIIRYQLIDATIVFTRTTIFGLIYGLIFAVSALVAYWAQPYLHRMLGPSWWIGPAGVFVLLASIAPFTSITLTRRAEDRLLRRQRKYQRTLMRASQGMMSIRDLNKLLGLIVHMLTRVVGISFAGVFLYDKTTGAYIPKAMRRKKFDANVKISSQDAVITWLKHNRRVLVREEIQFQIANEPSGEKYATTTSRSLHAINSRLNSLGVSLVVPSFTGETLLGFLVLGDKISGSVYSQDDLDVFTTLANQAALAIENAQFYQELQLAQSNLFQSEKLATIGQLAASIAHEIHNPLTIISGEAQLLLGRLNRKRIETVQRDDLLAEREVGMKTFNTIIKEVERASDITRRVLKHSRPSKGARKIVDINMAIEEALALVAHQVLLHDITLTKNFSPDLPPVMGDFHQIQEVFLNIVLHALDALQGVEEAAFVVSTYQRGDDIVASFRDNGTGFESDYAKNVLEVFSPVEGKETGNLGLFVGARIVRAHGGDINLETAPDKGSTFYVKFPVAVEQGAEQNHEG